MLVSAGDLMLDILVTKSRLRDGMPDGIFVRSGGSAANVAAWAHEAGYPSAWIGTVGDDVAGDLLTKQLVASGVQSLGTKAKGMETGVVLSWLGGKGIRTMHSARWAAASKSTLLPPEGLPAGTSALHVTGYSAVSDEGHQAVYEALLAGEKAEVFVSFDASDCGVIRTIGPVDLMTMLRNTNVSVLFANRREAHEITQCSSAREAAKQLARDVRIAIVKDGGRGGYVGTNGSVQHYPACKVSQSVDTTGAGDAFAGAWLADYLRANDIGHACAMAARVGARAIQSIGARPGTL